MPCVHVCLFQILLGFFMKDSGTFREEGFGGHHLGNSDDVLPGGERSRPVSQEPPGKDPP